MPAPEHPTTSNRFLHARALILLAVLALVVCVLLSACQGSRHSVVEAGQETASDGGGLNAASGAPGETNRTPGGDDGVHVHVTGAVRAPGLHRLDPGQRIADAIEKAGGFADDADVETLNLARVLVDGEQLVIPRRGEEAPAASAPSGSASGSAGAASGATAGGAGSQLNLNSATADQLQTLPGVGPSTAQKIIDSRAAEGPFRSVDDLTRVSGIGEKTLEKLRSRVTV